MTHDDDGILFDAIIKSECGLIWMDLKVVIATLPHDFYSIKCITCWYFDSGSYPTADSFLTYCVRTYETGIVSVDYFS